MITGLANVDGVVREFNNDGQLIGDATGILVDTQVVANASNANNGNWHYDPITNNWQYVINGQLARNTWFESNVTGNNCWYAVKWGASYLGRKKYAGFMVLFNHLEYIDSFEDQINVDFWGRRNKTYDSLKNNSINRKHIIIYKKED